MKRHVKQSEPRTLSESVLTTKSCVKCIDGEYDRKARKSRQPTAGQIEEESPKRSSYRKWQIEDVGTSNRWQSKTQGKPGKQGRDNQRKLEEEPKRGPGERPGARPGDRTQ